MWSGWAGQELFQGVGWGKCQAAVDCRVNETQEVETGNLDKARGQRRLGRADKHKQEGGWLGIVGSFCYDRGDVSTFKQFYNPEEKENGKLGKIPKKVRGNRIPNTGRRINRMKEWMCAEKFVSFNGGQLRSCCLAPFFFWEVVDVGTCWLSETWWLVLCLRRVQQTWDSHSREWGSAEVGKPNWFLDGGDLSWDWNLEICSGTGALW